MVQRLRTFFCAVSLLLGVASCTREEAQYPDTDPRLSRPYCNDPEAVNYNWDFPGTPDNSVCLYPAEAFAGTFTFLDSVYNTDGTFDSAASLTTYTLRFDTLSRRVYLLRGFCADSALRFSADRFFRSTLDSLIPGAGQRLCRAADTVAGAVTRAVGDTARLTLSFSVRSDTGTAFHRGTAYRQ